MTQNQGWSKRNICVIIYFPKLCSGRIAINYINKQLIDFISASPSAYHAVENVRRELDAAGYTELFEGDDWSVTAPGKYYVRRNGSSIIALRLPKPDFRGFMVMAAHSDSPSFKIKWNSDVKAAGMYTMLNVE